MINNDAGYKSMSILTKLSTTIVLFLVLIWSSVSIGQVVNDPIDDIPTDAPKWTDIVSIRTLQKESYFVLYLEMSDAIPNGVQDSSIFQILLDTYSSTMTNIIDCFDHYIIQFEHNNWDGARWFSMFLNGELDTTLWPGEKHRMFDWKIDSTTLAIRFSLKTFNWDSIKIKARVFYKNTFADFAPDTGYMSVKIDPSNFIKLNTVSSKRNIIIYPEDFDSVLVQNQIPDVLDFAYDVEQELAGYKPVGGDTLRFIFHPLYDGAAIEGDPIYVGPAMWGKAPLWFVYFHEMGHNFCNASASFNQLYPLQYSVPPGPLPANILFYEAFATVPAMYVYERIEQNPQIENVSNTIVNTILDDWHKTRTRFMNAWEKYKANPLYTSLTPDIVDGMFLELISEYGWGIFNEFYRLMHPTDRHLPIFEKTLPDDTSDLRKTRSTFTTAILSTAANVDLSKRLKKWGFPIDDELYNNTMSELAIHLNSQQNTND